MDVRENKSNTLSVGARRGPDRQGAQPGAPVNSAHNHTIAFQAVRSINHVNEKVTQPLIEKDAPREASILAMQPQSTANEPDNMKSGFAPVVRDVSGQIESDRNDLKQMVRIFQRLTAKALDAHGVRCRFTVEPDPEPVRLSREKCRSISLMFKETLSYITHHIRCAAVTLSISVTRERLEVEIREVECVLFGSTSGTSGGRDGDVLGRMQARIIEAAGTLQLATMPSGGSLVTLTVPLVNVA